MIKNMGKIRIGIGVYSIIEGGIKGPRPKINISRFKGNGLGLKQQHRDL